MRILAKEFKCDPKTISNGLKKLGKKRKLSQWIPHEKGLNKLVMKWKKTIENNREYTKE